MVGHLEDDGADGASLQSGDAAAVLEVLVSGAGGGSG